MAQDQEYTPKPMPTRDANAPVADMNFNGLNSAIRALKKRLADFQNGFGSTVEALGSFIKINLSLTSSQAAAYNISKYGLAKQGHLHKMTIAENQTIPSDWCLQTVNSVVESGITVTVEVGGLWFVDA